MPTTVLAVRIAGFAGWAVILAGLRRGLPGRTRGPALFAHAITPASLIFAFMILGFGSLYATIALAAEYWALILVTRLRPERLLDSGGLALLAVWAAVTAAFTLVATHLIL